ncbi:MAG: preprotein translocase subunit SecG [Sulfuricellaceae bacterium]|jgi:preprotein translocase subunit SecG
METLIWIINVLSALGVIGLVLLQHGKGADMGAAFGSGSAGGLFGSRGAANFLSRSTAILAAVFFATSLALGYVSSHKVKSAALINVPTDKPLAIPAAPADNKGPSTEAAPSAPKAKDIPN